MAVKIQKSDWMNTADYLLKEALKPKEVLKVDWLEQQFKLPEATTFEGFKKRQFMWLQCFEKMREYLLRHGKVWLRKVPEGYEVVPPENQTKLALEDYSHAAMLKLQRMRLVLANVDQMALTSAQRKENADALSKQSQIAGFIRTSIK